MRVIKQGTPPPGKMYQADCDNCSSRLEENVRALRVYFDERIGAFATAKCPVCGSEVVFLVSHEELRKKR